MRAAVFVGETSQLRNVRDFIRRWKERDAGFEEEYFLTEKALLDAAEEEHYDIILVIKELRIPMDEYILYRFCRLKYETSIIFVCGNSELYKNFTGTTYKASFNGKQCLLNMEDICFFESYDRKTSIVTHEKKIRIKARLDVEEQKLSGYPFVRINRWNLINIRQIRALEGDTVRMNDGSDLYVSNSRRKDFLEKYEQYVTDNYTIL